jgi:hypothetical protein
MTTTPLNPEDFGYTLVQRYGSSKPNGTIAIKKNDYDWVYYAPPAPNPTLPTAPWTVIRVLKSTSVAEEGRVLTRGLHGTWFNAAVQVTEGNLQERILKFEVLAEPVEDAGF